MMVALIAATSVFGQQVSEPARPLKPLTNAQTANMIAKSTGSGTTLTDSLLFDSGTRIGLGTTDPKNLLHVFGTPTSDVFLGIGFDPSFPGSAAFNMGYSGATFGRGSGFFNVRTDASAVAPNPSLRFATGDVQRMIITNIGRVGIGTSTPTTTLDVVGSVHVSSNMTVDGNVAAKYQDVAEWVPANADLAPGTVVVLDPSKSNTVVPSERAYDTMVAGVVSARPGLILGEEAEGKEAIATTGRVKVHVDARKAPIKIGDLLVTSDIPGTAMRSEPFEMNGRRMHQPGTIIGKALEPLSGGVGEILVLLSMQ
jgi:hypothetical protein